MAVAGATDRRDFCVTSGRLTELATSVAGMARRIGYLFTLAVPVAIAGYVAAGMLGFGSKSDRKLSYDTVPVSTGSIRKVVATSGPVRALVTVSIGSQLSGMIEEVRTDFNSEVKPGAILATIDAKSFHARVAQAKADLAVAEAALANAEAALQKAEAGQILATRTIGRQKSLADKGFTTQSTLDTAVRDSAVAKAEIAVSKAQIESAKATIVQRRAFLDQAQIDLDRTEIRSPIEGTVISRTVDPGQTVAASLQAPELFKIAQDLKRVRIEAQVNEADVGSVSEGNPATFTVDAYPDRQFDGRVTQVRLSATEIANVVTYTVIIEAENDDRKLFPGMTANVSIESATRTGVLRVPNDVFRYRPREESSSSQSAASDRSKRMIERLKGELSLTAEQEKALAEALEKLRAESQAAAGPVAGSASDQSAIRQRYQARIEQTLAPLMTEAQRPAFDAWRRGRETSRIAFLWVLGTDGLPVRKFARIGIADDQFTEVVSGDVKEGDNVIVRARETGS